MTTCKVCGKSLAWHQKHGVSCKDSNKLTMMKEINCCSKCFTEVENIIDGKRYVFPRCRDFKCECHIQLANQPPPKPDTGWEEEVPESNQTLDVITGQDGMVWWKRPNHELVRLFTWNDLNEAISSSLSSYKKELSEWVDDNNFIYSTIAADELWAKGLRDPEIKKAVFRVVGVTTLKQKLKEKE